MPSGTPSGVGVYLTLYPPAHPNTDSINLAFIKYTKGQRLLKRMDVRTNFHKNAPKKGTNSFCSGSCLEEFTNNSLIQWVNTDLPSPAGKNGNSTLYGVVDGL